MGKETLLSNALLNLLSKRNRNEETFGYIQGVHVIADDLIIEARYDQDHDNILHRVLSRARDKGVKFNIEKIKFKIGQIEYMSNIVSSEGLNPGPKKIEAIVYMPKATVVNRYSVSWELSSIR